MNTKDKIVNLLMITVTALFILLGSIAGYGMFRMTEQKMIIADLSNEQVELLYIEITDLKSELEYVRSELKVEKINLEKLKQDMGEQAVILNRLNYELSLLSEEE